MELDRQSIEKRDFPIGRRGYEPEAVDAHLDAVSREVEALKQAMRSRPGESLASTASAQVQAIVEAAETTAADIERQADLEATRIRQDASREAESTREDAVARSREHVGKVSEASAMMVQRVDAMESELGALFESLRTGANRLNADLSLLAGNMAELYGAAGSAAPSAAAAEPVRAAPEPEHRVEIAREPESELELELPVLPEPAPAEPEPSHEPEAPSRFELEDEREHEITIVTESSREPEPADDAAPAPEAAPAPAAPGGSGDIEGARLIALNMALNGQPREETDRYLAENFELEDRASLLDEVYSAVGG